MFTDKRQFSFKNILKRFAKRLCMVGFYIKLKLILRITRNTCMQQSLAYILQTLFQHEVFVITPTLKAGSRCSRHVGHGNTIIGFF
jgi:hypothetical protein